MAIAKVFQSGNSQAVRIPNEFRTKEKAFEIHKYGGAIYLTPVTDPWCLVRQSVGKVVGESFKREQTSILDLPEREGF